MTATRSHVTRRRFLHSAALAGAGAIALPQIVPSHVLGAGSPSNKLNIALLGSGNRSKQLLPSILQAGENVVAMCDVDPRQFAKIKEQAKKHRVSLDKATVYDDYRKLLDKEKVDAVVVAAGQRWHVPLSVAAMKAGKHVFCEKPLAHSCADARQVRELAKQSPKLATQVGSQGGSTDTFRRSMEVIQAGLLGQIHEVHCWINRGFPASEPIATTADPIPDGLNWDFWCGPSKVLPFKEYYLGGCLKWGRWLEFGDGHLADMGAHGLNLPWRALKLGQPVKASVEFPKPLKDSYPSATTFRWDFAARQGFDAVSVYWHDGDKAGPPEALARELLSTYGKPPTNGVLFAGEKGILCSNAWGVGGVMKLTGDAKCRGVADHAAGKSIPVTLPRAPQQNHMQEWIDAAKGGPKTFQGFETAADICEIAMTGIVTMRLGRPIEWDTTALAVKNCAEAVPLVHREQRKKWLV